MKAALRVLIAAVLFVGCPDLVVARPIDRLRPQALSSALLEAESESESEAQAEFEHDSMDESTSEAAVSISPHVAGNAQGFGDWIRMMCGSNNLHQINNFQSCAAANIPGDQRGVYEWATGTAAAVEKVVYVGKTDENFQSRCGKYNPDNWNTVGAHKGDRFRTSLDQNKCVYYRFKMVASWPRPPSPSDVAEGQLLRGLKGGAADDEVYGWNVQVPSAAALAARITAKDLYAAQQACPAQLTAAQFEIAHLRKVLGGYKAAAAAPVSAAGGGRGGGAGPSSGPAAGGAGLFVAAAVAKGGGGGDSGGNNVVMGGTS